MNNKKPLLMYFIGISGSGKTSLASRVAVELQKRGMKKLQFIDGDVIRDELGNLFGYTFEERMKNNKVVSVVASYLLRNNINVLLAQVGGYSAMRDQIRKVKQGEYVEVYVKCSLEECERRDVKGYYEKAGRNEMDNINGRDAEFEVPKSSDIIVDTEKYNLAESVNMVMNLLESRGYVSKV